MSLEDELRTFRGGLVEGVGGYRLDQPLPGSLSRRARRADLVRRIKHLWYIRSEAGWKAPADRISLIDRILGRLRGPRPQSDLESRRYWEERGGEGYDREAFSADWLGEARRTFRPLWDHLSAAGVRSLLEVGCGTGRNLTLLRELEVPRILGFDFSFSQLGKSKGRGFDVGQASAKALPARAKSVDAVMFAQVLIHVPPPIEPALSEALRVARRYVALLEQNHPDVGLESSRTGNPHCFRHNLVGNVRKLAPGAELIELGGPEPGIRLFRLS